MLGQSSIDLQKLLVTLKEKQFFGKVEIEIARGEPKVLRISETHLLSGERSNEYSRH